MNLNISQKVFAIFCFVLLLAHSFNPVFAHPGGTDHKGGHHVGESSEYHYHHGLRAHDHPDGICPYEKASIKSHLFKTDISGWLTIILIFLFLVVPLISSLFFDTKNTLLFIISVPFIILSFYIELIWEFIKSIFIFFKNLIFKN